MSRYYTVNGIKFSEAKSGLQKCIRRGLLDKAISYAVEMDSYPFGVQKGNRTNLVNRLKIILVEDVCDSGLWPIMAVWFKKWHENREKTSSRRYLLSIVRELCLAKKLRLLSDYKFFSDYKEYRKKLGKKYDFLYTDYTKNVWDPNFLRGMDKTEWVSYGHPYDDSLEEIYKTFPKTNKERWLYSMASGVYSHLNIVDEKKGPKLYTQEEVDQKYDNPVLAPYKCGWLDSKYVVDIHTGQKRDLAGSIKFSEIGAYVENERIEHKNEALRFLYKECKKSPEVFDLLDPIFQGRWSERLFSLKTTRDLGTWSNPIFGQKVTASHKPFTIIMKDKVYKGPFKNTSLPIEIRGIAIDFRALGDDSVLVPTVVIRDSPNYSGVYLSYDNVAEGSFPPPTTRVKVKGDLEGEVVLRSEAGIYQGYELIKMGKMDYPRMFYHFCIRFILGRGDSGLWNYINNHGIDFDDRRHILEESEYADFWSVIFVKNPNKEIFPLIKRAFDECKENLAKRLKPLVLLKGTVSGENLRRYAILMKFLN